MEEFKKVKEKNKIHFNNIKNIVSIYTDKPEGNCFWYHNSFEEAEEFSTKQFNIYYLGSISNNIMEIGFNAGHSCLLMLLANPNSNITVFDICMHDYTLPCFEYINKYFPNRIELIKGNSLETVLDYKIKKFDLIHIDGYHEPNHVRQDIINSRKLSKPNGIVILDDDNLPYLYTLHRELIEYNIVEIFNDPNLVQTKIYTHLVCKYKYV